MHYVRLLSRNSKQGTTFEIDSIPQMMEIEFHFGIQHVMCQLRAKHVPSIGIKGIDYLISQVKHVPQSAGKSVLGLAQSDKDTATEVTPYKKLQC